MAGGEQQKFLGDYDPQKDGNYLQIYIIMTKLAA